jgi:hypothetical protein
MCYVGFFASFHLTLAVQLGLKTAGFIKAVNLTSSFSYTKAKPLRPAWSTPSKARTGRKYSTCCSEMYLKACKFRSAVKSVIYFLGALSWYTTLPPATMIIRGFIQYLEVRS